ncbi:hypothetical protein GGI35DRAFT_489316 [Trichoderma velutinum]
MPPNAQKTVIKLSYKDLVRCIKGQPPQQVKKGDPEWEDGIKCIIAYHSQATVLFQADQKEMQDIIRRLDYVIPPSAQGVPSSHKLMRAHKRDIKKGRSPSWAVFIILKTLYGVALPEKYIKYIRETFGTARLLDHTEEYFAIEGTEPAEPTVKSEKTSVADISSPPPTSGGDHASEHEDDAEEDYPTSHQHTILDGETESFRQTKKRHASALDIEGSSYAANKRTKVAGASSLSLPVTKTNNRNRRDIVARYAGLAELFSRKRTSQEVGCEYTIGKLAEMIDKKLEAIQDAFEKKIDEKFEAQLKEIQMMWDNFEKKMEEKLEAQTKELQMMWDNLEKKMEEKLEVQTKELQMIWELLKKNSESIQIMREAQKYFGEALTRLVEFHWQRPAAPATADV